MEERFLILSYLERGEISRAKALCPPVDMLLEADDEAFFLAVARTWPFSDQRVVEELLRMHPSEDVMCALKKQAGDEPRAFLRCVSSSARSFKARAFSFLLESGARASALEDVVGVEEVRRLFLDCIITEGEERHAVQLARAVLCSASPSPALEEMMLEEVPRVITKSRLTPFKALQALVAVLADAREPPLTLLLLLAKDPKSPFRKVAVIGLSALLVDGKIEDYQVETACLLVRLGALERVALRMPSLLRANCFMRIFLECDASSLGQICHGPDRQALSFLLARVSENDALHMCNMLCEEIGEQDVTGERLLRAIKKKLGE